jgi:hypothetical protein
VGVGDAAETVLADALGVFGGGDGFVAAAAVGLAAAYLALLLFSVEHARAQFVVWVAAVSDSQLAVACG